MYKFLTASWSTVNALTGWSKMLSTSKVQNQWQYHVTDFDFLPYEHFLTSKTHEIIAVGEKSHLSSLWQSPKKSMYPLLLLLLLLENTVLLFFCLLIQVGSHSA